ncbi:MAG: Large repetitive protein, partial [Solirubrobacterales bacterium]|nr:Large repetitive protein [Solirubrobacterales bacterium]
MRALKGLLGVALVAIVALLAGPVSDALASVTMEGFPGSTPTNNTTPSFSGSTTELAEPVNVKIYKGESTGGELKQTLSTEVPLLSTTWSLTAEPLGEGTYTAIAEQAELLGGSSTSGPVTFTIITAPPKVTLTGPPALSNKTKPSFSGKAGDHTQVVVHILNAANQQVTTATATPSGGTWSASNEGELESGSYHAVATQESSLGNEQGVSNELYFAIDTSPPTVTLTGPSKPSNDTTPSFSG